MTRGEITGLEDRERRELAPLTDAQRLTVDALALYLGACWRVPVGVDVTAAPSALVAPCDRGAVLAIVTADACGAPDAVTAVYDSRGARYRVDAETDYAEALAAVGGARAAAVRREGSAVYLVHAGGAYVTEADAERHAREARR